MLTNSLDLHEHLIFTGWREDIPAIINCLDIFVHCPTTFREGLARTCLETMAVGIPAVVSDNSGMPDAVADGVSPDMSFPRETSTPWPNRFPASWKMIPAAVNLAGAPDCALSNCSTRRTILASFKIKS